MRICTFLVLLFVPLLSYGQAEKLLQRIGQDSTRIGSHIIKADSLLTEHYQKVTFDTAYIVRPTQPFTARVRLNFSGSTIAANGLWNGFDFNQYLSTPARVTTSIGIAYRGLMASIAINPAKLRGKSHTTELNFNLYNNRYGVEFAYQHSKDYSGKISIKGTTYLFPDDMVSSTLINASAYYAFNHRRFSYPAALSQNYIQLRSAGSWMLAASFLAGQLDVAPTEELKSPTVQLRLGSIGIGGGYGYNWVIAHRWMLHASALPTLVIGSFNRLTVNSERQRMPYSFPEFIFTERVAVLHHFNKSHFLGMTFVCYNTLRGSRESMRMAHTKWRLRITYGFRF